MRSSVSRWVLAITLVAVAGGCAQPPATPAVDQAAISASVDSVNTLWTGAVAAKDSNAIAILYAEDAYMLPPNEKRIDGRDAIRASWGGMFTMPGFEIKPTSDTKIISEAGDMVVDIGTYEFNGTDGKGKPIHDSGKYVAVLKKVNGEWKYVVDTFNSSMPMPGM